MALSACGADEPAEQTSDQPKAMQSEVKRPTCERTEAGEITCIREAFELAGCGDLKPIGSMYKQQAAGFAHLTAFDASEACLTEVKEAALARGYSEDKPGEFRKIHEGGYSELLTISEDSTLQWEREQQ